MAQSQAEWFGHPRGLYVLFATEMWERFSYYGMRALLVLYLTKHFLFDDRMAAHTYGAYVGLVYALPVIGGVLADRYLGYRRAVVLGGVLLCLGHLTMAFEGAPAVLGGQGEVVRDMFGLNMTFLAMALIVVGVGFLKPNISSIVGSLYAPEDGRRDGGFTIFYMGINLGAAVATILVGWVGEVWGWSWGFGLAGIGMVLGLVTFWRGQRYLQGLIAEPGWIHDQRWGLGNSWWLVLGVLALVVLCQLGLYYHSLVGGVLLLSFIAVYSFWLWVCLRASPTEARHILLVIALTFCSVLFWALFEQAGTSMTLFADRLTDRFIGGWEIRASQVQSLNPIFILCLGPLFAWLWAALDRRGSPLDYTGKFALGIVQAGLGFAVLSLGISLTGAGHQVALIWLVFAYLLHTTGELCLSPVGLSMVTRLTPMRLVGTMMGTWFLASAAAGYVGGWLAGLANIEGAQYGQIDLTVARTQYGNLFETLGWMGIGIGVLVLVIRPWLRHLEAGR